MSVDAVPVIQRWSVMPVDDSPFDQASDVAAITTRQVLNDGLPILRVTNYCDDHDWAFVCGTTDATADDRVIAMREALELDPTLRVLPILLRDRRRGEKRLERHGAVPVLRMAVRSEGSQCLFRPFQTLVRSKPKASV